MPVVDRYTGEIREAQIFVAVLGCSNYIYAEATFTQQLGDWLGAHVRTLEYLGGVLVVERWILARLRHRTFVNATSRRSAAGSDQGCGIFR